MKKTVRARIIWTPVAEGGRKNVPPVGMRYCPVIVFEGEQPSGGFWSAEIYNTAIDGSISIADLSFLVDEAPYFLLDTGRKFSLYEGLSVVAVGVIL